MRITQELLQAKEACQEQLDMFVRDFPDGTEITAAICRDHPRHDYDWAAKNLLTPEKLAEYHAAKAPLLAAYVAAEAPLWAEYEAAKAPLWAEYEAARAPLLAEYHAAEAPLWAKYVAAEAPLWAEFEAARAETFGRIWEDL